MRDSKEEKVHKNYIKVGDIVKIENGMIIPVDGVCVVATGVMSDESSMTGESDHLPKETVEKCMYRKQEFENDPDNKGVPRTPHDVPSPVLLSGTQIQTGQGWFMCIVVGEMTCEGQILAGVENKKFETTPLQDKLEIIATDIGKLGMYAAIAIIHVLLFRSFIEGMVNRDFDFLGGERSLETDQAKRICIREQGECVGLFWEYIKDWLGYFIIGVAIVVVAVPEGLPLAVMISLAYSVQRMLKDQNFVKRLTSCEIMGGANNICSDKTGTLTKNQMTWTQIWAGKDVKIENADGDTTINTNTLVANHDTMELIGQAVACNTVGTHTDAGATELAMIKFVKKCGIDYQFIRSKLIPKDMIRF